MFGPLEGLRASRHAGPEASRGAGPEASGAKGGLRPTKQGRSVGRSVGLPVACRLYAPDAELAGTKVMRW